MTKAVALKEKKPAANAKPATRKKKPAEPTATAEELAAVKWKLRVEPVPPSLWGFNLRRFIPQSRWLKLRKQIIAERGAKCETCGKEPEKSSALHAHECFTFDETATPPTATLSRIELSCWMCHMCEHWGRLQRLVATGRIQNSAVDELIQHFCTQNEVERRYFEPHKAAGFAECWRLARIHWRLDWGQFTDLILEYYTEIPQPGRMDLRDIKARAMGCIVPENISWPGDLDYAGASGPAWKPPPKSAEPPLDEDAE